MKITRILRVKELNYDEDYARANGHGDVYDQGGCSLEWYEFGYEVSLAGGNPDDIMALVRYYAKKGYGVIPSEFHSKNTIEINHKTKTVHYH